METLSVGVLIAATPGVETIVSAFTNLSPGALWSLGFGVVPVAVAIVGALLTRDRREEMTARQAREAAEARGES